MQKHPVASFVLGAYVFAWGCWLYLFISTPPGGMQAGISPLFLLFALAGGLGPSLIAIILSRIVEGRGGGRKLLGQFSFTRGGPGWLLLALLIVPAVSALTLLVELLIGRHVSSGSILDRLALGIIWPLFASLGEEFGWRAFMLPRLQLRFKALPAALIVGVTWGCWHLMADFIGLRSYGWLFVPYFILAGPLLLTAHAIIMSWIYNSTRNMAYIVLYHFTITSSAILLPTLNLNPAENIVNAAIGVVLFWIIALVIILVNGPAKLSVDSGAGRL
jgi:uncharacterized protein